MFDRHQNILHSLPEKIQRAITNALAGGNAAEVEQAWRNEFADLLTGSSGATTLHGLEFLHPHGAEAGKRVSGMLTSTWRDRWANSLSYPADCVFEILQGRTGPDLARFPVGVWELSLNFTLASELFSKDETIFFAIDNPMRRDRALRFAEFSGPAWKGVLRSAWFEVYGAGARDHEIRIFGTEKPGDDGEQQQNDQEQDSTNAASPNETDVVAEPKRVRGRLDAHASLFDQTAFAVINPHDRSTKTGKPIFYEVVPPKREALLRLQYLPVALPMKAEEGWKRAFAKQAANDLAALAPVIERLLRDRGIGAKTSAGFGQIADPITGSIRFNVVGEAEKATVAVDLPRPQDQDRKYFESPGVLIEKFRNADGSLNRSPAGLNKLEKQWHQKAVKWWEIEGQAAWERRIAGIPDEAAPQAQQLLPRRARMVRTEKATLDGVSSIAEELKKVAKQIFDSIEGRGDDAQA